MGRAVESNILNSHFGLKSMVKRMVLNEVDALSLFFTDEMIDLIVECTNNEANQKTASWNNTTKPEMKKFIGLLLLAGVYKSKGKSLASLWGPNGRRVFAQCMSLYRMKCLLKFLRFDDRSTRNNRRVNDKFAPIRNLFENFTRQLPKYFNPSESITVDKQLVAFRGRCGFRQYMPLKPAKYGLKFFVATCSKTAFVLSMVPYLGKINNEVATNLGTKTVLELVKNYEGSGRNITTNNFYTNLDLLRDLRRKKLSLVGTLRKHRREVPPIALLSKGRAVNDCKFMYKKEATLLSLVPRKNKTCLILSSMHLGVGKMEDNQKADINQFYNQTKGGVDTMDKLVSHYSCRRMTQRWPMTVFYNIVDIAGRYNIYEVCVIFSTIFSHLYSALNAFLLYTALNPTYMKGKSHRRRLFLEEVGLTMSNVGQENSSR